MGRIVSIQRNPKFWHYYKSDKVFLDSFGTKIPLIKVVIGSCDEDLSGEQELGLLIQEPIFDKILSGLYSIQIDAYADIPLTVYDNENKKINYIVDGCIL